MGCAEDQAGERRARGRRSLWLCDEAGEGRGATSALDDAYDVREFSDGRSILESLSLGSGPDVLLVGEHLPPKISAEICRRVRERHDRLALPILAIAAQANDAAVVELLESGANDCVRAPFDAAELGVRLGLLARLRRTWQELDTERDRLRLATKASGVATWDFDPQTGDLYWDARVKELLGVSPSARGDYDLFLQAVHPDDRAAADEAVQRALDPDGTGEYRIECRMIGLEDRIERWIATQGRAFFAGGKAVRFIGTCLDVTEQKRAAIELERAREAAEAANRVKDQFLGTVSHELRTPLTAILGWTRMLASGAIPEGKQRRAVATIERNARAQARLVEDLLDFSSIAVDKFQIDHVRVEVGPAVEAAIEALRPAADEKGVSLEGRIERAAGAVLGDPARVEQIAWNLLSNAIKFTPGGGRVTVTLARDGAQIHLAVSDTGEGISADFLASVFERFRQADPSVTRAHGGLGLGLSIVKHLVEEHGGRVEAHSDGLGLGATFIARFPAIAP
jgi:PAS domain S-box-containing protein